MNLHDTKYTRFGLCSDMLENVKIIKDFDKNQPKKFIESVSEKKKLLITGEGSSRIFPAKNFIYKSLLLDSPFTAYTEGATQAAEYNLNDFAVFGVSNSGKTNEIVRLFHKMNNEQHNAIYSVVANENTPLEKLSKQSHILSCGSENSVAATKSVIEQALFFDSLLYHLHGIPVPDFTTLAESMYQVLTMPVPENLIEIIANADIVYFAGRNNGVAEELTLKTNEIIRKKSDFLEGTYAVHGIEEVMTDKNVLILIDPFENEQEKIKKHLQENAGVKIIAIANHETIFHTVKIPACKGFDTYLQLAAGWNLLVEAGIKLGINLDKPERARKIGNEFGS